jgi:glycoside hydrolase family 18
LPVPPNNYYYARQAIQIMNPAGKTVEDETDGEEVEVEE